MLSMVDFLPMPLELDNLGTLADYPPVLSLSEYPRRVDFRIITALQ
jgi:hypothetical protein